MKTIDIINEGVHDPHIFKAIYTAGGMGSGKSYITDKIIAGTGIKKVSTDTIFEHMLKKQKMDLKIPDEDHEWEDIRQDAVWLRDVQQETYIHGRLGLLIDGLARDFNYVSDTRSHLKKLGYDTMMIFVNTKLDIALERNRQRSRSVPEKLAKRIWHEVQDNAMHLRNLFGPKNFILYNNNESLQDNAREFAQVEKSVRQFLNKPHNSVAQKWIKRQQQG